MGGVSTPYPLGIVFKQGWLTTESVREQLLRRPLTSKFSKASAIAAGIWMERSTITILSG